MVKLRRNVGPQVLSAARTKIERKEYSINAIFFQDGDWYLSKEKGYNPNYKGSSAKKTKEEKKNAIKFRGTQFDDVHHSLCADAESTIINQNLACKYQWWINDRSVAFPKPDQLKSELRQRFVYIDGIDLFWSYEDDTRLDVVDLTTRLSKYWSKPSIIRSAINDLKNCNPHKLTEVTDDISQPNNTEYWVDGKWFLNVTDHYPDWTVFHNNPALLPVTQTENLVSKINRYESYKPGSFVERFPNNKVWQDWYKTSGIIE